MNTCNTGIISFFFYSVMMLDKEISQVIYRVYWKFVMEIQDFLIKLAQSPDTIDFNDTMAVIDSHYTFAPCAFRNGEHYNESGQNAGSCKLFAFAQLHSLTQQQTLDCFGQYYRHDVLKNPHGDDHQNIRNFITLGWEGISFEDSPLTLI